MAQKRQPKRSEAPVQDTGAVETTEARDHTVACDGGGALGHPTIYLEIPPGKTAIACPYCSRTFRLKAAH